MVGRLRLSRNQIARFVGNDPEAIKAIESQFTQTEVVETLFQDVDISAGAANTNAYEALAQLQRITDALELVTSASRVEQKLSDLADVYAPNVTDGDVIQWDNDRWVPAPASGSSLNGTSTITVANNRYEWIESVAALGVSPSDTIIPTLAPSLDADENDPELLTITSLAARAETDAIRFTITSPEPMAGPIKINWSAL